ncbi:MAG: HAMP domain-containing sensor histidine kinase [Candidatus Eremiobacteraeota bacterium]|nr:HAMP domain-containing sensor histidine kinase [Candidatus Eremiobacteraeota bacterium]
MLPALPALCYLLIVAVWLLDLLTPQLFIASILLNIPIALSSLALTRRLTVGLVVAAELANAFAAYLNAQHDHGRFDTIALGDRALLAASFLLVGFLAVKTQGLGRSAGLSEARAEQVQRERGLRLAMERIRESLNPELVRRTTLHQSLDLFAAERGLLVPDIAASDDWYFAIAATAHVENRRDALPSELRSLIAKRLDTARPLDDADVVARFALETLGARYGAIAPGAGGSTAESRLLLLRDDRPWTRDETRYLQSYFERCSNALAQAELFVQNIEQSAELAHRNQQAEERSGVIRDLVYALAHDLRTPLAASDVTMRQAERGAFGELPEAYRKVLLASLESNAESQRLVETLLTVARYESGDIVTLDEPIDLFLVAQSVRDELSPMANERNVRIEVSGDSTVVLGDAHELRRAMTNLTANAVAASPSAGAVVVTVESNDDRSRTTVEDHGYGIAPEERGALFQRFGVGRRRRGSGTGLGLYVVRLIVEKHGGIVWYEPCERGGSRFVIEIPVGETIADGTPQ